MRTSYHQQGWTPCKLSVHSLQDLRWSTGVFQLALSHEALNGALRGLMLESGLHQAAQQVSVLKNRRLCYPVVQLGGHPALTSCLPACGDSGKGLPVGLVEATHGSWACGSGDPWASCRCPQLSMQGRGQSKLQAMDAGKGSDSSSQPVSQ